MNGDLLIKSCPEDFVVEELLSEATGGKGEYLWVLVEKRNRSTQSVAKILADAASVSKRDVSYAGRKDVCAVTSQTFSVRVQDERWLHRIPTTSSFSVVDTSRHTYPLRLGEHQGNRFSIVVRTEANNIQTDSLLASVQKQVALAQQRGVPNRFGRQRYGPNGINPEVGRRLLHQQYDVALGVLFAASARDEDVAPFIRGLQDETLDTYDLSKHPLRNDIERLRRYLTHGADPWQALMRLGSSTIRFYLSAWQAHAFDRVLMQRGESYCALLDGDWLWHEPTGPALPTRDPQRDRERVAAFARSPTGPMFGSKLDLATGDAGQIERDIWQDEIGGDFVWPGQKTLRLYGERRPLRYQLPDVVVEKHHDERGDGLHFQFTLGPGRYATVLLEHLMPEAIIDVSTQK